MPELPEVETIRRTLELRLVGRTVRRVEIRRPQQVRFPDATTFAQVITGQRFGPLERRGKYLVLPLAPGGERLICHLRMSGRLYLAPADAPQAPHTHVIFHLDGGDGVSGSGSGDGSKENSGQGGEQLRYQDQRTFGGFHLTGPDGQGLPAGLATLGPEPLAPEWNAAYLAGQLAGRRVPVKALLLDQRVAAGLGNIYADEALFRAGVHPASPAAGLTAAQVAGLAAAARAVLAAAIEHRGTTFSLYFDGEGRPGDFYQQLQVFDRTGQPCYTCGEMIQKCRVAGRGTHFCPRCQEATAGARGERIAVPDL